MQAGLTVGFVIEGKLVGLTSRGPAAQELTGVDHGVADVVLVEHVDISITIADRWHEAHRDLALELREVAEGAPLSGIEQAALAACRAGENRQQKSSAHAYRSAT